MNRCSAANITDLILDIRYNGGGYLDIASELAYMIARHATTAGSTFERLVFNDKHPTTQSGHRTSRSRRRRSTRPRRISAAARARRCRR